MATLNIYNVKGEKVGKMDVEDSIFGADVNDTLLYQMIKVQQAAKRRGTSDTKTRAQVRGCNSKIYRQKGTGRARHGDRRSPIFVGGGVAFGPHPKDWSLKMPKKMRQGALKSALSLRTKEENIMIIDEMALPKAKGDSPRYTKRLSGVLDNLKLESALLIDKDNAEIKMAARNMPKFKYLETAGINVYDILRYDKLIISKQALETIQERLQS